MLVTRRSAPAGLSLGVVAALLAAGCGGGVDAASDTRASVSVRSTAATEQLQVYRVPSESMEPTLRIGTKVVVKREAPAVGAIVVFYASEGSLQNECGPNPHVVKPGKAACDAPIPQVSKVRLIKRVVAGPGDEIYIRAGHVYRKINGSREFVREKDSYIRACGINSECNFPVPIKIPSGHWFLMGDNRGASDDSRSWGPIPTTWIVGQATE